MVKLLRENWLWIVAPIVIVAALLTGVVWMSRGEQAPPFIYPIF